jgi:hypothetical protein
VRSGFARIDSSFSSHCSPCVDGSKVSEAHKRCQCNNIPPPRPPFAARNPRSVRIAAFWLK